MLLSPLLNTTELAKVHNKSVTVFLYGDDLGLCVIAASLDVAVQKTQTALPALARNFTFLRSVSKYGKNKGAAICSWGSKIAYHRCHE